jgi:uncharacterized OsmC-like protein
MKIHTCWHRLGILALAGFLFLAGPARAFWPKGGYKYKSRVVSRGAYAPVYPLTVGAGPVVTGELYPYNPFRYELSPFRYELSPFRYELSPYRYELGLLSGLTREAELAAEAGRRSKQADGGGKPTPTPTTTAGTVSCAELNTRMTAIEKKLDDLDRKVQEIDAKVTRIVDRYEAARREAELQKKIRAAVEKEMNEGVLPALRKIIKEQNQPIAGALEELGKDMPDKAKIREYAKKLRGE